MMLATVATNPDLYGAASIGAFLGAFLVWIVCIALAYEILLIVSY